MVTLAVGHIESGADYVTDVKTLTTRIFTTMAAEASQFARDGSILLSYFLKTWEMHHKECKLIALTTTLGMPKKIADGLLFKSKPTTGELA